MLIKHYWCNGAALYDDDDELYYEGYYVNSEDDFEGEFEPLDWAMNNAGCTRIDYRNGETGKMETL